MHLKTKLILYPLTTFMISLLFMGLLIFSNSKTQLENHINSDLKYSSTLIENQINLLLFEEKHQLNLVATQQALSNEELQQMINIDPTIYELFVVNSSGIIIASSDKTKIGLNKVTDPYFVNARNHTYVRPAYFSPTTKENSFTISTPFHDGVLVGRINLESFNKITSDRTGLGETGENLLAYLNDNNEVVYFSQRRFSNNNIEIIPLEQTINRPVYYALTNKEDIFYSLNDYRNEQVISVTNYIPEINLGLVTKIDQAEAFQPINHLQELTLIIAIISILSLIFLIYVILTPISKDIENITDDIDSITKGNLEIQLQKSSTFELQSLTDSLNRILASMKLAILRTGMTKESMGLGEAIEAKEQAELKYQSLYEHSSDALMFLSPPDWKFTSGNPAAIKIFAAKDEKEFTSKTPSNFSPKIQPDGTSSDVKAKQMIKIAMKKGSNFFKWTHKRLNGEEFPATVLLTKIKLDNQEFLQATVRDISKEKKIEAELEQLRESIALKREKISTGREKIVGKRETTATGRERMVEKRENIKKHEGREGIALGRERIVGSRETTATGREKIVTRRETNVTGREKLAKRKESKQK